LWSAAQSISPPVAEETMLVPEPRVIVVPTTEALAQIRVVLGAAKGRCCCSSRPARVLIVSKPPMCRQRTVKIEPSVSARPPNGWTFRVRRVDLAAIAEESRFVPVPLVDGVVVGARDPRGSRHCRA